MNAQTARKGTNWKPLLLIPAAIVIAKGASRRRARWDAAGYGPGGRPYGHGHHGFGPGFAGRGFGGPDGREFRLPPKIETMLDAWHTQAHQHGDEPETTTV
jgi:hypothetical protein